MKNKKQLYESIINSVAKEVKKALNEYNKFENADHHRNKPDLLNLKNAINNLNPKYKAQFGTKAKMLSASEVESRIGHAVGGVCPFAINDGVAVYLDVSMKRFETVFPACGSSSSAIELTMDELERYSSFTAWIDVCKGWN